MCKFTQQVPKMSKRQVILEAINFGQKNNATTRIVSLDYICKINPDGIVSISIFDTQNENFTSLERIGNVLDVLCTSPLHEIKCTYTSTRRLHGEYVKDHQCSVVTCAKGYTNMTCSYDLVEHSSLITDQTSEI